MTYIRSLLVTSMANIKFSAAYDHTVQVRGSTPTVSKLATVLRDRSKEIMWHRASPVENVDFVAIPFLEDLGLTSLTVFSVIS